MKTLLSLLAFAVMCGFLGILVWYVPRWDLGLVVGTVALFAAYDLFVHERRQGG